MSIPFRFSLTAWCTPLKMAINGKMMVIFMGQKTMENHQMLGFSMVFPENGSEWWYFLSYWKTARQYYPNSYSKYVGLEVLNVCFAPLDLESSSARSSQLAGRLLDVVFPHMGRSILDYVSGNQTHVRCGCPIGKRPRWIFCGSFKILNVIPGNSD